MGAHVVVLLIQRAWPAVEIEATMAATSGSRKVGYVLGSLHLVVTVTVVRSLLASPPDAQWQMVWIPFFVADLPFSLLVLPLGFLLRSLQFSTLPYPASEVASFWLPAMFHGVFGSIWYFFLPQVVVRDARRIASRFHRRATDDEKEP
jgi:hypothetical protein